MRLNHLNLSVNDAQGAMIFLETYFSLRSIKGTKDKDTFIGMEDENGFVLTLMQENESIPAYPSTFHLGFLKQPLESIHTLYQKLKTDGYPVEEPKAYRGKGIDLYVTTPFGFTIQVST